MESKVRERVIECLPELFKIASGDIDLAKKIYSLMPREFGSITCLKGYLLSDDIDVFSFAAEIAMDNFEGDLTTRDLLEFQKSHDSLVRARARVIAIQRRPKKSEFVYLVDTQKSPFCRESANLARELLMVGDVMFGKKLTVELLFEFLESSDETVQAMAKNRILSVEPSRFSVKKLLWYKDSEKMHIANTAAEVLLSHFEKRLDLEVLMGFQKLSSNKVKSSSRKLLLELGTNNTLYSSLLYYKKSKDRNVSDVATELILKNFNNLLTGIEIINLQRSHNPTIRGMARDLALSLPIDKFSRRSIKKAASSGHAETKSLGIEMHKIYCSFQPIEKEASDFLEKYSLI